MCYLETIIAILRHFRYIHTYIDAYLKIIRLQILREKWKFTAQHAFEKLKVRL